MLFLSEAGNETLRAKKNHRFLSIFFIFPTKPRLLSVKHGNCSNKFHILFIKYGFSSNLPTKQIRFQYIREIC